MLLVGMRSIPCLVMLCLAPAACTVAPGGIRKVWDGSTPPANLAAPSGFTVTPAQAARVARGSNAISLKSKWTIYADSKYYYFHDAFFGDEPYRAYVNGLRVDGRTGRVVLR